MSWSRDGNKAFLMSLSRLNAGTKSQSRFDTLTSRSQHHTSHLHGTLGLQLIFITEPHLQSCIWSTAVDKPSNSNHRTDASRYDVCNFKLKVLLQ